MEANQVVALVGGIFGGVAGLIGGGVGTFFSIKNTAGPRERAFVIRCSLLCWSAIGGVLGLLFLLPIQWKWLVWIPVSILMPLSIRRWNKEQARIHSEETAHVPRKRD